MQQGLLDTYKRPSRTRGLGAWVIALLLMAFYVLLYFPGSALFPNFPDWITPISNALHLPNKWLFYALVYSVGMCVGGWFMLKKHGNSRYHRVRTYTLLFVQVVMAFLLPWVLQLTINHDYYLSYFWPLSRYSLYPSTLKDAPLFIALYFIVGSLVGMPLLAYFKGKRVYCSWICGCGGLAETFGDPWRHLSDKSSRALKIEQVSIYSVLAMILIVTGLMLADAGGTASEPIRASANKLDSLYGFFVGAIFSGVAGTGLYPLMGTRVWCRFGCPMAAILGLIQKFGRFRITTKPDMCIACGNCSTYCEMGIDVRAYAMNNLDIRRASCVGCGMCAHVCPRGVLKLETRRDTGPAQTVDVWTLDL
jgi:ferredoxin-type protein NapH